MAHDINGTIAGHSPQKGPITLAKKAKGGVVLHRSLDSGAAVSFELSISSLHSGVRFGLLYCQPEPVPRSLPARIPQLTPQYPCGPLV